MSKLLPSQRAGFFFLEYCRVTLDGERVVYAKAAEGKTRFWAVPHVNTSAILLGNGTSITQGAMRKLADERVLVAFTGTGGTPIFFGSTSEYAATSHLQDYIKFWPCPASRLACAKEFSRRRCNNLERLWPKGPLGVEAGPEVDKFRVAMSAASDIERLRGHEGDFAKAVYKTAALASGIEWQGRSAGGDDRTDLANRYLDVGNYLAYGLAGVVLWALGIPPGLAVSHGATRAGGLVFDLADCIKDALILPHAFTCAKHGSDVGVFRERVIDSIDAWNVLPCLFEDFLAGSKMGQMHS